MMVFGVVGLLVFLVISPHHAFVLKRSAADENQLTEALRVIARERRRLQEPEYPDYYWDDAQAREDPADQQLREEEELQKEYGINAYLQELFDKYGDRENAGDEMERVADIDPRTLSRGRPEPMEDEFTETAEKPVDDSELLGIFSDQRNGGDGDVNEDEKKQEEVKRTIPWQLGGPIPDDKPDKKDVDDGESEVVEDGKYDSLSSEEVAELLSDADETEQEALQHQDGDEQQQQQIGDVQEEVEDEEDEVPPSTEPVSDNELKDVFEDNDIASDTGEVDVPDTDIPVQEDEEWTPELSKEWLQYLQQPYAGAALSKKKRSGDFDEQLLQQDGDDEDEEEAALTEEEDEAIVDIMQECLQQFINLEDEENSKLAKALNLATLGQVERTDKYIVDEIGLLKEAVDSEDQIAKLRRCLQLGSIARGTENVLKRNEPLQEEEEEEEEPVVSQELMEDIPELTEREDVQDFLDETEREDVQNLLDETEREDVQDLLDETEREDVQNLLDETEREDVQDMLDERMKQYLMPAHMQNRVDNSDMFVDPQQQSDWHLNPFYRKLYEQYALQNVEEKRTYQPEEFLPFEVPEDEQQEREEEDAIEEEEEEIENALASYISQLSPAEKHELKDEVTDALNTLEEEEEEEIMCPAVAAFSDGCAYGRQLGLDLDTEATDLCDRHHLCYSCGSGLGLSVADCDAGFLAETDRLCGMDDVCQQEAAGLFAVVRRGHEYDNQAIRTCSRQCVLDYIMSGSL